MKNIIIFISFLISIAAGIDLPTSLERCNRTEPDFDVCLVGAVNKALQTLKDGNEEFGIKPLEPLHVKSLIIETGAGSPISLKQTFKNVEVLDLIGSSRVVKYNTNLDKYLIICDSKSDRIQVIGDYEMSGRILLIPITGKGRANLTLVNTIIEHQLIGEPVDEDGEHFIRLKQYKVNFKPKRVYMHFENLFNDKLLSDNMNRFMNDNWELVFNELKKGYADNFGRVFKDITNKIFTKVPMDKIFLK